ncbi:hypothetical protein [Alkalihalophilus marmarensis]|uniref:hypothetical protein n=1 Tax=Alkalihalophilus marmarensis TaxID=521377 RepID=UPI002E1B3CED|nr:hypothetical protein [Alkalihalophilus marmarensis]
MIREALQYIVGMGKAETHEVNGQAYSDKQLHVIKEPTADAINVRSLSGLVEYIKSEYEWDEKLMIHVVSPTEVVCFDALNTNKNRNEYIQANAMIPSFNFDNYYDTESFNIKLQSVFVQNEDRDIMLKVVGNIKEEDVKTYGDDGVSQLVTAKSGAASVTDVVVPNPVSLKPFRTFVEVEQPVSEFIFRMRRGPQCALFEADGGAWKLHAMKNIKNYLISNLQEEINADKIVVIA